MALPTPSQTTNPWQNYVNAVNAGNYYGSSGYWGDLPSFYGGISRPGEGWPGSRARVQLAQLYGVQPQPSDVSGIAGVAGGYNLRPFPAVSMPAIDPNNPAQRYRAVSIPRVGNAPGMVNKLFDTFATTANAALSDFNTALPTYRSDVERARLAGLSAADTSGTIGALTQAQRDYVAALNAASGGYRGALDQGAAAERGVVGRMWGELPSYDRAAQAIADKQWGETLRNIAKYRMASGTPTSAGSDEARILARAAQDVYLPTEMAKINQRYNILGGYALPVEQGITGREIGYQGTFLPSVAASQYTSGTNLANAINALKAQTANMSFENASRYMQALQVPIAIQQQILGTQIGQAGQLAQLEQAVNYQGLQDLLGVQTEQPMYFNMNLPQPRSYPIPTYPSGRTGLPVSGTVPTSEIAARTPVGITAPARNPYPFGVNIPPTNLPDYDLPGVNMGDYGLLARRLFGGAWPSAASVI